MSIFRGIRGMAQAFLRSAAEAGMSANEAIRQLQSGGLQTYRRTDMLKDYRQFLGIPERADKLQHVRLDYRPSRNLFTDVMGFQRSRYRYQVNIYTHNPVSGKDTVMSTNVASDVQLTRRQIEEAGLNAVLKTVDDYKDDIVKYNVAAAFHRADETWD